MFRIYPYKVGSASVKKLKTALNAKIIKLEGSKYRHRDEHIVINWGNSRTIPVVEGVEMLNMPTAVGIAANKLQTFEALDEMGVATVPYTTDPEEVEEWVAEGNKVFVRNSLTGHSGEGIEVIQGHNPMDNPLREGLERLFDGARNLGLQRLANTVAQELDDVIDELPAIPAAPLYTLGIVNDGEYRVHVFRGDVILYQKKSRRVGEDGQVEVAEGERADIRNLASNWIYRTGNLEPLERVEDLAVEAVDALGLDFGAVDIIKDTDGNVYVLEVNTAAGLGNADSLEAYTNAFNNLI